MFVEFEAIEVDGVLAELDPKAEDVVLEPPTVSRG